MPGTTIVSPASGVDGTAGTRLAIYGIEGGSLALFLMSAVAFTALLEHPGSPVRQAVADPVVRRALTGVAMGLTFAGIAYSPWGRRSGAHLNPAVTLSFLRLGKIARRDAAGYVAAQFAGSVAAVVMMRRLAAGIAADPAVNYVATLPGPRGTGAAFAGELVISFGMMATVLLASNSPRVARYTAAIAACLVALYITIEAPLSGMSMNAARSLGPALAAGSIGSLWIYFTAPLAGMLLAAEIHVRRFGPNAVRCAKLHHPGAGPCHFKCQWMG